VRVIPEIPNPLIEFDFEKVYSPSADSYLFIDYIRHKINHDYFDGIKLSEINNVLDLGTGTGIIAIYLQLLKSSYRNFNVEIYASDILEEALDCAKKNEKINNINQKIKFIKSDLFKSFPDSLKHSFEIIIFNSPYLPSLELLEENDKRKIDYSWNGGKIGYEVILDFLSNVKDYLNINHKSYIYFISSSKTNLEELNEIINQKGFKQRILAKKHIFFEDIVLNRLELI
jgi:release factor glutamine methyltransferase